MTDNRTPVKRARVKPTEDAALWIANAIAAHSARHDDAGATIDAAIAQAYATLALAEQQRIANLLALAGFTAETKNGSSIGTSFDAILTIRTAVAEMLGVSETGHVS